MTDIKNAKQIVDEKSGLMIRVDKTLKEMMEEKPSSRWDVRYWHPKYEAIMDNMDRRLEVLKLGSFIEFITYGQVGERIYDPNGEVFYIQTKNILDSGVSYFEKFAKIKESSHNDPIRSRLKEKDVLVANAGMGAIGKVTIFLSEDKVNISQDIDLLRLSGINTFYVVVFIKSIFGNSQLWRRTRGVGAPKLPFEEIAAIKVPLLPKIVQSHIEDEYLKMYKFHKSALLAKQNSNEDAYRKNLTHAEEMLKDLVAKAEVVIRGERKDVI
jgi:hypothetical protein